MSAGRLDGPLLWEGLRQVVLAQFDGEVSLAKFMGESTDEAARDAWLGYTLPLLDEVAKVLPVRIVGPARVEVGDGVQAQLDIGGAVISVDGVERWWLPKRQRSVPLFFLAVGERRWGERWTSSVLALGPEPSVLQGDSFYSPPEFCWFAMSTDEVGARSKGTTRADAELAASVEAAGVDRVVALFHEFEGVADV